MNNSISVCRDTRIDSIKFCLMVLVIVGHTVEIGINNSDEMLQYVWNWIYIFHMPLFVFISGYFSYKQESTQKNYSKILSLFEPFLLLQFIYIVISLLLNKEIKILTPWWVSWYLLSLIFWRIILQIVPSKILKNTKFVVITVFVIGIIAGFLPFGRILSIQRTLSFLPFFFMGYYMRGKKIYFSSKCKIYCLLFLLITVFILPFISQYLGDLTRANLYVNVHCMVYRILGYLMCIPMSIAFINICPNNKLLAEHGRYTMQYFVYHAVILYFFKAIVEYFLLPTSFIFCIFYSLVIIVIIWSALRISLIAKFVTPFSLLIELNRKHNKFYIE